MSVYVMHFKRYLKDQTVSINSAAAVTIPDGWYSLPDLMYYMGNTLGETTITYAGLLNQMQNSAGSTYLFSAEAGKLTGIITNYKESQQPPNSTFFPEEVGFLRNYFENSKGRALYDAQSETSLAGDTWGFASAQIYRDIFQFSLVEKEIAIGSSIYTDFTYNTQPWEQVFLPHKGIQFLFKSAEFLSDLSIDYSTLISAWDYKLFSISDIQTTQQSLQFEFPEQETYYKFNIPVIYQGTGVPS